jgi:hypothetical protein
MTASKDGESGEVVSLTLVNGAHGNGLAPLNDALDKSTTTALASLRQEHRDLDEQIQAMIAGGAFDQLHLTRLKKRKLMLRDQIARIEDDSVPDIIA